MTQKTVRILGTHGVPAAYGGFETAAENVGLLPGRDHGWRVVVYCQVDGRGPITEDMWHGIERVIIPIDPRGWLGTSQFDWSRSGTPSGTRDVCLTFGYNTAVFNIAAAAARHPERRSTWTGSSGRGRAGGSLEQAILYVNERIACFVGNHLIADHPEIETLPADAGARAARSRRSRTAPHAVDDAPTGLRSPYAARARRGT